MENLIIAIEQDAIQNYEKIAKTPGMRDKLAPSNLGTPKPGDILVPQTPGLAPSGPGMPKTGIVNLRFEECKFSRKAAALLHDFLKTK